MLLDVVEHVRQTYGDVSSAVVEIGLSKYAQCVFIVRVVCTNNTFGFCR
jgi:hypothetical protein